MPKATRVTPGQLGVAHHLNDLITDIREHTHGPGEGVVSHGDLSDGAIDSGVTHTQLNTHVQGSGTDTDPDNIGGAQGVHGLPAGAFVLGSESEGVVMDSGFSTTDGYVSRTGWKVQTKTISFGVTYSSVPAVMVAPRYGEAGRIAVGSLTTTGCVVYLGFNSNARGKNQVAIPFSWLAIGVRA